VPATVRGARRRRFGPRAHGRTRGKCARICVGPESHKARPHAPRADPRLAAGSLPTTLDDFDQDGRAGQAGGCPRGQVTASKTDASRRRRSPPRGRARGSDEGGRSAAMGSKDSRKEPHLLIRGRWIDACVHITRPPSIARASRSCHRESRTSRIRVVTADESSLIRAVCVSGMECRIGCDSGAPASRSGRGVPQFVPELLRCLGLRTGAGSGQIWGWTAFCGRDRWLQGSEWRYRRRNQCVHRVDELE
jgi:hypothetical protein